MRSTPAAATADCPESPDVDDFTEYTYVVSAGPIGTFADRLVERTFEQSISEICVTIVSGDADDIGYVGGLQVTDAPPRCARVGRVQAPVDVMGYSSWQKFPSWHPLYGTGGTGYTPDVTLGLEVTDMSAQARTARANGRKTISISAEHLFQGSNIHDFGRYADVDIAIAADGDATLPSLIEELPGGAILQYVVGDYHSPGGTAVEGKGVPPDILVAEHRDDFTAGRDPVLDTAVTAAQTRTR